MKVIEPGHIYEVDQLDFDIRRGESPTLRLVFVNREVISTPENPARGPHPGSQTQEYIRVLIDCINVLIDRTNHCDSCLRWEGNDRIIKNFSEAQRQLRLALLHHEARALERGVDKGGFKPEDVPVDRNGHFIRPTDRTKCAHPNWQTCPNCCPVTR